MIPKDGSSLVDTVRGGVAGEIWKLVSSGGSVAWGRPCEDMAGGEAGGKGVNKIIIGLHSAIFSLCV